MLPTFQVLSYYNEAALYSSDKGLGHTLARRAAYLLQTDQVDLALRDIQQAFELGCLEEELLEFLLAHSVTDDGTMRNRFNSNIDRSLDALSDPSVSSSDKHSFVGRLREQLEEIRATKKGRVTQEDVERIVGDLRTFTEKNKKEERLAASSKSSSSPIKPPTVPSSHPLYPSFCSSVTVEYDSDKGRKVVAAEDIQVGDLVMVEKPNTLFFSPPQEKVNPS